MLTFNTGIVTNKKVSHDFKKDSIAMLIGPHLFVEALNTSISKTNSHDLDKNLHSDACWMYNAPTTAPFGAVVYDYLILNMIVKKGGVGCV